MSAREELIKKYAADLQDKCGITADMDLLTKVTIGCGPSIYNADASTIAASQPKELETVKNNFLMKKLGSNNHFVIQLFKLQFINCKINQ